MEYSRRYSLNGHDLIHVPARDQGREGESAGVCRYRSTDSAYVVFPRTDVLLLIEGFGGVITGFGELLQDLSDTLPLWTDGATSGGGDGVRP